MSTYHPGKWIRFFVWGSIAATYLFLGSANALFAQAVQFGIKAGVPFTGLWQAQGPGSVCCSSPFQGQTHYAIGPAMEIRLPGQFGLEVGAMYKRIAQQAPDITLLGFNVLSEENSVAIFETHSVSKVGRSWEFPVAMRYHFSLPSIRPYVEGGYSYNHLEHVLTSVATYNPQGPFPQHVQGSTAVTLNRGGFLLGSGVDIKLSLINVTPGIRYTHYDRVENSFFRFSSLPYVTLMGSPSVVDFLVGVNLSQFHSKTKQ